MQRSGKGAAELHWEGAAGRQPTEKIVVRVEAVERGDKGALGSIQNHPSLAGSMPDPMVLRGDVVARAGSFAASAASVRYPRVELKEVAAKDRVALGLVGGACICLERVPDSVGEQDLPAWLAAWRCAP
jgi:hypothetical protein